MKLKRILRLTNKFTQTQQHVINKMHPQIQINKVNNLFSIFLFTLFNRKTYLSLTLHFSVSQMNKSNLKKKSNLKNLKCKEYREMTFPKNAIILRKNQSFRHVYLLKSGQAAIQSENDSHSLHVYNQGEYLNAIEISMEVNSIKTIKAVTKCQVLLMIFSKNLLDEEKKNVLIPKIQQLKFYEIMIFKTLSYGLMLELVMHFRKEILTKFQITDFLKDKHQFTCFIVSGTLVLESHKKKPQEGLRTVQSCSRKSLLQDNNLRLLKFEAGQILFLDTEDKYYYVCESQKCEVIYIATDLLQYYLPQDFVQRIKQLKESQQSNVSHRQSKTFKALKSMSKSISRENSKSYFIPQKFQNKMEIKCQKFEKARSVHYAKNNREFRSYSEEKKRIMEERDKGYKQISELNRRKYGRNYIYQKRLQISRNIHGQNYDMDKEAIATSDSDSVFFRRGVTVYETVTLKDDYGIIKQSPIMKFVRRNRLKRSQSKKSQQISPAKPSRIEKEIESLTLNSVQKIRKDFDNSSKTLLKNHKKKEMILEY